MKTFCGYCGHDEHETKKCPTLKSQVEAVLGRKWKLGEVLSYNELMMLIASVPCCHTTGMHDPEHTYICSLQEAKQLTLLQVVTGITPTVVPTPECYWCYGWKKGGVGKDYKPKYEKEIAAQARRLKQ